MNNSTFLNYSQLLIGGGKRNRPNRSFIESFQYIFGIVEGVLSPVVIIVNIIVIVAILSNPKLRQKFPYLLIVSISVSDLITGLITCPIRSNVILTKNYNQGCATYIFITLYEEFIQNFVASWSIVSLNTDLLLTMFNARLPKLTEFRRRVVLAVFTFLPWLTMCCVVFPVAFTFYGKSYFSDKFCHMSLNRTGKVVIMNMAYVLPSILLAIQVILLTTTYACRRRSGSPMTSETISPGMCILASSVVVVLMSPQQIAALLGRDKVITLGFKGLLTLLYTSVLLSDLIGAVLPFVWFMCQDIRTSCLELYNKMPWRSSVDVSKGDMSVRYKNFE